MSPNEKTVLLVLAQHTAPGLNFRCLTFKGLEIRGREEGAELDRKTIRRCCRSLKRKRLAEFHKGLWTDDGEPAGAGYCISREGQEEAKALEATDPAKTAGGFAEARLGR